MCSPLLLALLATPSTDAARRKRTPQGPPVPALPHFAEPAAYPIVAPQLAGPAGVLSLEGLSREEVRFRFEADVSVLSTLDVSATDAVFAQLSADPRWRVSRDQSGKRVAEQRRDGRVGPGGWHIAKEHCSRVALREPGDHRGAWTTSERVTRVPATASVMDLDGFRPDGGVCARMATALRVEGALILEVFEAGASDSRPVTVAAMGNVPFELANLQAAVATIRRDGYDALSLPDDEPHAMFGPSVELLPHDSGIDVRARVNPQARGWTWVRVLDSAGAPWEERAMAQGTLEQLGWSHDVAYGFFLQGVVVVPPGPSFTGTLEVWFQPPGGPPRRLHAAPVTVPGR